MCSVNTDQLIRKYKNVELQSEAKVSLLFRNERYFEISLMKKPKAVRLCHDCTTLYKRTSF